MSNTTTVTKNNGQEIARTPKDLEPLIKEDLKRLKEAEKDAERNILMPIRISIGEKLNEAKPSFTYSEFTRWIRTKIKISSGTANEWMRISQHASAEKFTSVQDFRRTVYPGYTTGTSKVRVAVEDSLKRLRVENYNLRQHTLSQAKERALERKLGLQLIDIGFKVLSVKLHPDKGGSHEAMQRLNRVRKQLKQAA